MGKLADLIAEKFGCKTREEESPLGAAAIAVAAPFLLSHPDRLAWVFVNLSPNPIFLGLTDGVTANNGIEAQPNGGFVSFWYGEDYTLVGRQWWMIAPAGASFIYVLEIIASEEEA